ncbi:hypothetical protein, partial [Bartonella sp. AP58NXGY]|uniref:hypothetical protein n=1 Tax=Bartonella sp. AP58NXGY TaxID=3243498 RepID=UPI0035D08EE7
GLDIGEAVKLSVDLELSIELELCIHCLSEADAVLEREAVEVWPDCKVSHSKSDEGERGRVIHMDFGGEK